MRWFASLCLLVPLVAVAFMPVTAAQPGWRVEPGIGYGPIRLEMTPEEVRQILGKPAKEGPVTPLALVFTYQTSQYWFWEQVGEPNAPKLLTKIVVWDARATTRGGIQRGSSLLRVMDVFGDTEANYRRRNDELRRCLTVLLLQQGRARPVLFLDYMQVGIRFELEIRSERAPVLTSMEVLKSQNDCPRDSR